MNALSVFIFNIFMFLAPKVVVFVLKTLKQIVHWRQKLYHSAAWTLYGAFHALGLPPNREGVFDYRACPPKAELYVDRNGWWEN